MPATLMAKHRATYSVPSLMWQECTLCLASQIQKTPNTCFPSPPAEAGMVGSSISIAILSVKWRIFANNFQLHWKQAGPKQGSRNCHFGHNQEFKVTFVANCIEFKHQKSKFMKAVKLGSKPLSMYFSATADFSKKNAADRSSKHSHFKKSSSLPIYYLNKERMREITEVYRSMSTDKITTQTAKTRRNSSGLTPEKQKTPFTPLHSNFTVETKQKGKLTIQRGRENTNQPQPSGSWAQLAIKLRSITDRLQDLLNTKSEENFLQGLEKYMENLHSESQKKDYSGREELLNCVRLLGECMSRRERGRIAQVRASYDESVEQLACLEGELKKKCIRAMLDQKQAERQQQIIHSLQLQLDQLRAKSTTKQACFGTEDKENLFTRTGDCIYADTQLLNTQLLTLTPEDGFYGKKCCNCKQELERKDALLTECVKKLQALNRKHKEILSVLVVLRGEGVNVERIYHDILNGCVEVPENDASEVGQAIDGIRKQQRRVYRQLKAMPVGSDIDADNSIISSADGLSFNYDEKSLEEDVFTVRREYKCKKQLRPELKEQLRLNFDVLYDEQLYEDDYQSQAEMGEVPPTI